MGWREYGGNPVQVGADEILESVTVARHPRTGEYFAFHRRWGSVRGHVRRLVAVATSRDFRRWQSRGVCLAPDEQDDAWVQDEGQRTEFYGMAGFVYGGQFLAFLPVFDVIKDARGESGMPASVGADGSAGLHAPVAISKSGLEIDQAPWDGPIAVPAGAQPRWSQLATVREPFAESSRAGAAGSFDGGCILCSADRPIVHGDEVWHYYTAVNTMHGGPMPPKTISIGRAAWRLDGFVSLDAGHFGGMVETVPLQAAGNRLVVNVDAAAGSLAVELSSADGNALAGYTRADCQAVHADSVRHTVRWNGDAQLPRSQPFRLRFHLQDASLYSFRIEETDAT